MMIKRKHVYIIFVCLKWNSINMALIIIHLSIQNDIQVMRIHRNTLPYPCQFYNPRDVLLQTRVKQGPHPSKVTAECTSDHANNFSSCPVLGEMSSLMMPVAICHQTDVNGCLLTWLACSACCCIVHISLDEK